MVCGVCDLGVSEDFIIEVRSKSLTYDFPMVRVCGPTCLKAYWDEHVSWIYRIQGLRTRDAARQV